MPKVLPSQLTDEEILALLESEDQVWDTDIAQVFDYNDDIVPFLSNYQITPGATPVSKKLLYKLYKAYSKQPLDGLNFNLQLGGYLSHTKDHYLLNIDQFAISHHIYQAEKTRDKTKSLTFQKHFMWFTREANFTTGRNWVEGFILFYIYKDFCKQRRVNPKLGYVNFHKFLKLHFQYKRLKGNRALWFKVNDETASIFSEEEKNVIRKARQQTRGSKKEGKSGTEEASAE